MQWLNNGDKTKKPMSKDKIIYIPVLVEKELPEKDENYFTNKGLSAFYNDAQTYQLRRATT